MKKKKITKYITLFILIVLLLNSSGAFAQTGFDDNVDDETPRASIDDSLYLLLIGGAFLGYFLLRRRGKIS